MSQPKSNANRNSADASERHDLRILNAIRQIIRAADIDSRRLAAEHQITAPQLMSLMAVVEKEPTTAVEVAHRVHLSPSTLVGVLDRLESKGLVKRDRNRPDRREVAIVATEAGRKLVAETPFPLQFSLGRALTAMSGKEREQVAATIELLVRLMGADELDASPVLELVGIGAGQSGEDAARAKHQTDLRRS